MLDFLKRQWNLLTQLSAWAALLIGGFWREPPVSTPQSSTQLGSFGQFFLTLSIGLMAIPAYHYRKKQHTRSWLIVAVALVTLTPVAYFLHDWLLADWTCPYGKSRVIVGSDDALIPIARQYMTDHALDRKDLVMHYAGDVEKIWERDSIETRRLTLGILYVAFLPLFVASMISVIQAFYCGTRSP